MGLLLWFQTIPAPRALDRADDGLAAGMDVDVLNRDFLLALAAVPIEGFEERRERPGKLVGLRQVLAAAFE